MPYLTPTREPMGAVWYRLVEEPRDAVYERLIETTLRYASFFTLTVQPDKALDSNGQDVLTQLQTDAMPMPLIEEADRDYWHVSRAFELNPRSAELLTRSASSLYAWLQPRLPEDLQFFREDKHSLLVTVSYDEESLLTLFEDERDAFVSGDSGLVVIKEELLQNAIQGAGVEAPTQIPTPPSASQLDSLAALVLDTLAWDEAIASGDEVLRRVNESWASFQQVGLERREFDWDEIAPALLWLAQRRLIVVVRNDAGRQECDIEQLNSLPNKSEQRRFVIAQEGKTLGLG